MRAYKYEIPHCKRLDALNAASAFVWNECLKLKKVWDYAHGYRMTSKACEAWMDKQLSKFQPVHSQSIQTVRERYFKTWQVFFALRKHSDKTAKPPHKRKGFQTTTWKKSAIRFKETIFCKMLVLSLGKGRTPLKIPFPKHLIFNTQKRL